MNRGNIGEEDYHLIGSIYITGEVTIDVDETFPFGYLLVREKNFLRRFQTFIILMIFIVYGGYRIFKTLDTFWERLFPGIMFLVIIILCIYQIVYSLKVEKAEDETKILYVEKIGIFVDYVTTRSAFGGRKYLRVELINDEDKKYSVNTSLKLEKYFFEGMGCTTVCKGKEVVRILAFDTEL